MVKLNVFERLVLLQILPIEGDFASLQIVRKLQESIGFNESEFKEFELKQNDNGYIWNKKGSEDREIEIGERANEIIIEALKNLDKQKKLTFRHVNLYEKFINKK